jgi:hypothetical protein
MGMNSNVVKNYQTAEYGKFVELVDSSQFPPVSVVRLSYPDTSSAFPSNSGLGPLSSVDIYPKYAVLSYIANPEDIKVSLSAGNINVSLDQLELNTDEIESLIRTTNFNLSTISRSISSTNPRLSSIDTKLTTLITQTDQIEGYIDQIENLLTTSNQNTVYLSPYNYQRTITPLTSGVFFGEVAIFSIHGTSYAGYDQYLQINDSVNNTVFSQLIKAGENFNFEFSKGYYGEGISVRNSLSPISYTPGNNDIIMTISYNI